jgi:hypothetical protein
LEATIYASKFDHNQIQMDMLQYLNKDYLKKMQITLMGDVIAILQYAKQVYKNVSQIILSYFSVLVSSALPSSSSFILLKLFFNRFRR